jgi:DNA-binding transcriptional LysR family regulator
MAMFDIWLLRSFVTVAESGGFTRAAKLLNSTQSTVSAQIQRLEEEAGRPLFVRTRDPSSSPPLANGTLAESEWESVKT